VVIPQHPYHIAPVYIEGPLLTIQWGGAFLCALVHYKVLSIHHNRLMEDTIMKTTMRNKKTGWTIVFIQTDRPRTVAVDYFGGHTVALVKRSVAETAYRFLKRSEKWEEVSRTKA
jgi:hypothetical protein